MGVSHDNDMHFLFRKKKIKGKDILMILGSSLSCLNWEFDCWNNNLSIGFC